MFFRALRKLKRRIQFIPAWLFRKLSDKQFLMVGAVVVGVWTGLTAVTMKVCVHFLHTRIQGMGANYSWVYLVSPGLGILLTYLLVRFVLRVPLQKGTSHVLLAIAKKSSVLPAKETFTHATTSALTIGFGGSAGLESPIVQTGAAVGSTLASFFPVSYKDRTLLLACGAASGIATVFNAPIAGVLFALEVLLVDVSISAFIPLLIAGATGALCSQIILSDGILFSFRHNKPFDYHILPYFLILGVMCGLLSVYYIRASVRAERYFTARRFPDGVKWLAGSALLGLLILLAPPLFGEGYPSISALANDRPEALFTGSPVMPWLQDSRQLLGWAILAVAFIKVIAVSLTINAGGNGGNFAPALLVGACLGYAFSYLFDLAGWIDLPTEQFCLVAMAGVLTGIFHSPLTGVFLIAEISGGYDLIIPLMIVSALSTAVSKYLQPKSLDEEKFSLTSQFRTVTKDINVLSGLRLRYFIEKDFMTVSHQATLRQLVEAVSRSKRNIFPVVDKGGALTGVIMLEDIREIMFKTELYDTLTTAQLMRKPTVVCSLDEDMNEVMEKFDKSGAWNMPVLEGEKYLGFVSKSRIFSEYRERLMHE
ncbi:MAG: chloride channel protein [Cyclobacteriaceae bacterium]|nr:chloride channel protein [Cyclobacteriaceae bacterium]